MMFYSTEYWEIGAPKGSIRFQRTLDLTKRYTEREVTSNLNLRCGPDTRNGLPVEIKLWQRW